MRRTIALTSVLVALLVSMLVVHALAQEGAPTRKTATTLTRYTCSMHPQVKLAKAGKCPMCGMALVKAGQKVAAQAGGCCGGGTEPRASAEAPDMMRLRRVVMSAPIFLDSPSVIYGQATYLELSEAQKTKLLKIEREARQKALAVLSDGQRKKLGDVPDTPTTMMEMCDSMISRMHRMVGDKKEDMRTTDSESSKKQNKSGSKDVTD